MLKYTPLVLFFVLLTTHTLAAEEQLYQYTLKNGRVIVGQAQEFITNDTLTIKLWFKTRFMGSMKVKQSDIALKKRYEMPRVDIMGKDIEGDEKEDTQLYKIALKDERVIIGIPSDPVKGTVSVKLWFKGRLMGVMSINESDIHSITKIEKQSLPSADAPKTDKELSELFENIREKKHDQTLERMKDKIVSARRDAALVRPLLGRINSHNAQVRNNENYRKSVKASGSWLRKTSHLTVTGKRISGTELSNSAKFIIQRTKDLKKNKKRISKDARTCLGSLKSTAHCITLHKTSCIKNNKIFRYEAILTALQDDARTLKKALKK